MAEASHELIAVALVEIVSLYSEQRGNSLSRCCTAVNSGDGAEVRTWAGSLRGSRLATNQAELHFSSGL